jgi:hypothetical protein
MHLFAKDVTNASSVDLKTMHCWFFSLVSLALLEQSWFPKMEMHKVIITSTRLLKQQDGEMMHRRYSFVTDVNR